MCQSEKQQCEAIRALLGRVRLERLWTDKGPTGDACRLLQDGGGPMSHGEIVMLRVAFDLWNGHGKATVDELISVLDDDKLRAVLGAIAAGRPGVIGEARPRMEPSHA
jgi:hypothetical protein